jgi:hypothetical protein
MTDNLKWAMRCKFVTTFAVFLFAATCSSLFAELVPLKVLLAYKPSYEYQVELENRRHNLELLKFREQTRAAEANFSKAMIDCANTPPEENCAKKAAATEMNTIKAIQKREVDENKLHLDNLDKLATNYAFGKH